MVEQKQRWVIKMIEETIIELISELKDLAPQVFNTLVKQARLHGIGYFVFSGVLLLLSIFFGLFRFNTDDDSGLEVVLLSAILFIIFIGLLLAGIYRFNNPEYYAIILLIDNLR